MAQKLPRGSAAERIQFLEQHGFIKTSEGAYLRRSEKLSPIYAEKFIENAIGYFSMPLGIANHFVINDAVKMIPMAIEETSVIASASKTAKWIKEKGEIKTETLGTTVIGQVQIPQIKDLAGLQQALATHKAMLVEHLETTIAYKMKQRGGGVRSITLRDFPCVDGKGLMGAIHIEADVCDAMGANLVNQLAEGTKRFLTPLLNEQLGICILSNLNPQAITRAEVILRDVSQTQGCAIEEVSLFAESDSYRAATHNKGIMNGIDAVLMATGNDWRAVEAGLHAYAGMGNGYRPLSTWRYDSDTKNLKGIFEGPIAVGIVGGVTALHPDAKIALQLLNVNSAAELAEIVASVGLVQNLGALKALAGEGIIQGHMRLHIENIAMQFDLKERESKALKIHLTQRLQTAKIVSVSDAIQFLGRSA